VPFVQQTPRLFTKANVEALNPEQLGVYGIYKDGMWIYVGQGDVRQRLLDHLNGDNPCILNAIPTHWVDEIHVDATQRLRRERELLLECRPSCNQRVG
jgi:hypothetical protein